MTQPLLFGKLCVAPDSNSVSTVRVLIINFKTHRYSELETPDDPEIHDEHGAARRHRRFAKGILARCTSSAKPASNGHVSKNQCIVSKVEFLSLLVQIGFTRLEDGSPAAALQALAARGSTAPQQ
jgi:hypothetical protein